MIVTIDGPPISKARHRSFVLPNGQIRNYDPIEKEKKNVKLLMLKALNDALNSENKEIQLEASNLTRGNNFEISISMYLPLPDAMSNCKRNRILWGLEHHPSQKDLDNLVKFYLDCANGILFPDDHMITKITATKQFSSQPRTVLNIMRKKDPIPQYYQSILELFSPEELELLIEELESLCSSHRQGNYLEIPEQQGDKYRIIADILTSISIRYLPKFKKIVALNKIVCNTEDTNSFHEQKLEINNFNGPIC